MRWIYRHPVVYDMVDSLISFGLSDRVRRSVVARFVPMSLLDVGVGSGKVLGVAPSRIALGIDTSGAMLSHVRRHIQGACLIRGDAHRLPLRDACIDVSIFSYCLSVLARPVEAVREALRVSSRVVIIEYDRPDFVPGVVWDRIFARFGRSIFGSGRLAFRAVEGLARRSKVERLYRGLYRVIILEGSSDG